MKPISCGALFYAYDEQERIGIILGHEAGGWLPFKGCNEYNETYEQTAIREVQEETCYLIHLNNIKLDHRFESHAKIYMIGLCEVPYEFLLYFRQARQYETRWKCQEKSLVKFFKLESTLDSKQIHGLSKNSIKYYWSILQNRDVLKKYGTKAQLCIKIDKPIKSTKFTNFTFNKTPKKNKQHPKSTAVSPTLVSPKISFAQMIKLSNQFEQLNINQINTTDPKTPNDDMINLSINKHNNTNTVEDLNDRNIKAAPTNPNITQETKSESVIMLK